MEPQAAFVLVCDCFKTPPLYASGLQEGLSHSLCHFSGFSDLVSPSYFLDSPWWTVAAWVASRPRAARCLGMKLDRILSHSDLLSGSLLRSQAL